MRLKWVFYLSLYQKGRMDKKKHLCEQKTGMGNVKSTRLEDLEYDVANLKNDNRNIKMLYENLDRLQIRMKKNEEDPTILDVIKVWIRRFLNVQRRFND